MHKTFGFKLEQLFFTFSVLSVFYRESLARTFEVPWGYLNEDASLLPSDWYKDHPRCNGTRQSPINILPNLTVYDEKLQGISISWNSPREEIWELKNNGFSFTITPLNNAYTSFTLTPENTVFKLSQMHFHWRGSEHYVNNYKFAAELHMVHQSVVDPNRFAVLGFMFNIKLIKEENPALTPIINQIDNITVFNTSVLVRSFSLTKLIPLDVKHYFRYQGSLTTPGCDEIVDWVVIDNPVLEISENQLLNFQTIENTVGYPILTNSRPVQEINQRLIRRSFRRIDVVSERKNPKSASGLTEQLGSTGINLSVSNSMMLVVLTLSTLLQLN